MDLEDLNCVQKRVRIDSIDVHPTERAIVVNYELEACLVGDLGDTMLEESRECQKIIRVKSLNEWTDISELAKEIIEKCDLIPSTKYNELTTLLKYLKTRKDVSSSRPQTAFADRMKNMLIDRPESELKETEEAQIDKLDEYIELLYEDLSDKIKGSFLILKLSRNCDNLIELTSNETLICALARVLREDGKKSLELAINIIFIFACFSNYSQFHSTISQFKVGSISYDLVECELGREESWIRELNEKRALADGQYNLTAQSDFEKSLKRYQLLIRKQNNFLRIVYYFLLNLSEDLKIEQKMVNKGIIGLLVKTLERDSQELLLVVVTFLKKLSVYLDNKNQMKELSIIEKLAPLLSLTNENLITNTLKLMYNLVFDNQLRIVLIKIGLIPKLMTFVSKNSPNSKTILSILYQISRDDKWKALFSYSSECINLIINRILKPNPNTYFEIISLAINLSVNQRNAQLMCDNSNINSLIIKVLDTKDSLLLKLLRNISYHDDPIKMYFLDYHKQLIQIMVTNDSEEVVVECISILSNLTLTQIDWNSLFIEYKIFDWIEQRIKSGNTTEEDIILQIAIFIGTAAQQEECALYLLSLQIIKLLIDLLNAKQEDDEIVIQIMYAFYVFIRHPEARDLIVKDSKVAEYAIDLMHDRNKEIKSICDITLDVIAEHDIQWASKIKIEKFCAHNKQWLEMVDSENNEGFDLFGSGIEESLVYPELLIKTDLLNDSSSDNLSDEHSIQLSVQGMALRNESSAERNQSSPQLIQSNANIANVLPNKRPQTGYKKRTSTATTRNTS